MALSNKTRSKAFSLLELIITIAILSIGIIAIIQALAYAARITGLSCDIVNAVFLGEDKIQELEFQEGEGILNEGTAQDIRDKFQWRYAIVQEPDLNLYKLDLGITWQRANREEELSLNTYLRKLRK